MARLAFTAAVALLFASASLPAAAAPCAGPVRPGRGIGKVEIGMRIPELPAVGVTVRPLQGRRYAASADGLELHVEVDGKQRVQRIRLESPQICIDEGRERLVDLASMGVGDASPLPGCGMFAAQHRSSWQCPEQGVEFFWEGKRIGVSVFAPSAMKPYLTAPPPVPLSPEPVVVCEPGVEPDASGAKKEGCREEPPPDPCQGNIAPMPELACGFFGRDARLAVECYLVDLCMGTFTDASAGRIQLYGADGWRGALKPSREGRGMRHHFASPPPIGTKLRVVVDAAVAVTPPDASLPNAAAARSEVMEQMATGKPASIHVRNLVGGRQVPGGFVLDLQVPRSAFRNPRAAGK